MLRDFVARKRVRLSAVVGIFPANSAGDDIELFAPGGDRAGAPAARFFGLRQQAEKEANDEPYLCLSDFVAPKGSGVDDWVGMFACTAGHGLEEVVAEYKAAGDDYR